MADKAILRIYMPASAKYLGATGFWKRIFAPSLGGFLLKSAKEFGIEQAIFQRVFGGYLKGRKLVFEQGEIVPPDMPQCVELIGEENTLRRFKDKYNAELKDCRLMLLRATELPA
ncbi:MAG: hypothetical protein JST16_03515 [Bdellovibrionales bacterium]|nr:hypothetical protein [Bdellovibrionales bacterium]